MRPPIPKAPEGRKIREGGLFEFGLPRFYRISLSILIIIFVLWIIMEMYGDMIGEHRPKTIIVMDWVIFCDMVAAILLGLSGLIVAILKPKKDA